MLFRPSQRNAQRSLSHQAAKNTKGRIEAFTMKDMKIMKGESFSILFLISPLNSGWSSLRYLSLRAK